MNIFLFFLTLCFFCLVVFVYLNIFYSFYLKVPMLSTGNNAIGKVLQNIDFREEKKFYDLGSGNGKLISQIASRYPNLKCIGIEYNVVAYYCAKFRNIFLKQEIDYRMGDFFKINISDADVVYVYLYPGLMERLEIKFASELKKGALVISNAFPIKTREPKIIIQGEVGALNTLYVYEY